MIFSVLYRSRFTLGRNILCTIGFTEIMTRIIRDKMCCCDSGCGMEVVRDRLCRGVFHLAMHRAVHRAVRHFVS